MKYFLIILRYFFIFPIVNSKYKVDLDSNMLFFNIKTTFSIKNCEVNCLFFLGLSKIYLDHKDYKLLKLKHAITSFAYLNQSKTN